MLPNQASHWIAETEFAYCLRSILLILIFANSLNAKKAIARSLASTLLNFGLRFDCRLGPIWVSYLGYDQMVLTSSSVSQRSRLLVIASTLSPKEQHPPFQIGCSFVHSSPKIVSLDITYFAVANDFQA